MAFVKPWRALDLTWCVWLSQLLLDEPTSYVACCVA